MNFDFCRVGSMRKIAVFWYMANAWGTLVNVLKNNNVDFTLMEEHYSRERLSAGFFQ